MSIQVSAGDLSSCPYLLYFRPSRLYLLLLVGLGLFSRAWPIGDRSPHAPGSLHLDISSGLTHPSAYRVAQSPRGLAPRPVLASLARPLPSPERGGRTQPRAVQP